MRAKLLQFVGIIVFGIATTCNPIEGTHPLMPQFTLLIATIMGCFGLLIEKIQKIQK